MVSAFFFWRMPDYTGHEISGRKAVEISSRKGADKEADKAAIQGTQDARGIKGWGSRFPNLAPQQRDIPQERKLSRSVRHKICYDERTLA